MGGTIRGIRYQANWSCKWGAFYFLEFLPLFCHMMRTLRTSIVVLAALLAAVPLLSFVWFALFTASIAVAFVCFLVRLFTLKV